MNVPKRISKYAELKQAEIDRLDAELQEQVRHLQTMLHDSMVLYLAGNFIIKDGNIIDVVENYQILSGIKSKYAEWTAKAGQVVPPQIAKAVKWISSSNEIYFKNVLSVDVPEGLIESTTQKLSSKIGLRGFKIIKGGWMDSVIRQSELETKINDLVVRSITGQTDHKDFLKSLSDLITGKPTEVLEDGQKVIKRMGSVENHYSRYTFDLSQQLDRSFQVSIADEIGMEYFLFSGTLIQDSRDFCVAHCNKVWSREEAEQFKEWTPAQGEFPSGYTIQAKDPYKVPSYISSYPGYNGLIDLGGWRCRHGIVFIPDELAFELRPELKKQHQTS